MQATPHSLIVAVWVTLDVPDCLWEYDTCYYWEIDGEYHRIGGPAVVYQDGTEEWYKNGKLHREDGPAYIYPDDREEFYLEGSLTVCQLAP